MICRWSRIKKIDMATRELFQQHNTDPTRRLSVSSNNSQVNDIDNSLKTLNGGLLWLMVFNATFNNISVISWRSVLLVEETGENHLPVVSYRQTYHIMLHSPNGIRTTIMAIGKFNYQSRRPPTFNDRNNKLCVVEQYSE